MKLPSPSTALVLAAAVALAPAGASAAPAGDEYLPKVPNADGGSSTGSPGESSGDSGSSASGSTGSAGEKVREEKGKKPDEASSSNDNLGASPASGAGDSENGNSGLLDTLLDPVVLLLIIGVIVTAVGMTLRRRQDDGEGPDAERDRRDPANAPHTPDGEIVAGSDPTS